MKPLKALKRWWNKPKKENKIPTKIRFTKYTRAKLEKPPPDGICCVDANGCVIVTPFSALANNGQDSKYYYFRVLNPFLAVKIEAPDLSVVRIEKQRFHNLKYRKL